MHEEGEANSALNQLDRWGKVLSVYITYICLLGSLIVFNGAYFQYSTYRITAQVVGRFTVCLTNHSLSTSTGLLGESASIKHMASFQNVDGLCSCIFPTSPPPCLRFHPNSRTKRGNSMHTYLVLLCTIGLTSKEVYRTHNYAWN